MGTEISVLSFLVCEYNETETKTTCETLRPVIVPRMAAISAFNNLDNASELRKQ